MNNVMIDLETLGQRAGCAILAIGAVAFDPATGQIGESFYNVVNTRSCCERYKLHKDEATLQWWRGQSDDARKVLEEAANSQLGLEGALSLFTAWMKQFPPFQVQVWSNGADFDLPILVHCYAAVGKEAPWKFWNSRCHRTLKTLGKAKKRPASHNALQDAVDQAHEAMDILRRLVVAPPAPKQPDMLTKLRTGEPAFE